MEIIQVRVRLYEDNDPPTATPTALMQIKTEVSYHSPNKRTRDVRS